MNQIAWHRARLILGAFATLTMAVSAVFKPELRYPLVLFMLLGLVLTWREFQIARPI